MEQKFLSREETADVLRVSVDTIDRLANHGHLKKCKIGARTLYPVSAVSAFADKLIREGAIWNA